MGGVGGVWSVGGVGGVGWAQRRHLQRLALGGDGWLCMIMVVGMAGVGRQCHGRGRAVGYGPVYGQVCVCSSSWPRE